MYSVEYMNDAIDERKKLLQDPHYIAKIKHSKQELQMNANKLFVHYINSLSQPTDNTLLQDANKILALNDIQSKKLQYLFDSSYSDEYILLWLGNELKQNIYIDKTISQNFRENLTRQWFRKLNIIGRGQNGVAIETTHTGVEVDFVIKTSTQMRDLDDVKLSNIKVDPRKEKIKSKSKIIQEFIIGAYGLNKLRTQYHIPNFSYVFGMFDCGFALAGGVSNSFCVALRDVEKRRVLPNSFIIYENIKSSKSFSEILQNESIKNIFNYFIQCVFACYSAYKLIDFTHYDLHTENVMIRPLPDKYARTNSKMLPTIHYPHPNVYLEVENVATIIDYGYSHMSISTNEFEHSYKDSVNIPLNENDKKLLGTDKLVANKKVPFGVIGKKEFLFGILGKKSSPNYDFFKLLTMIIYGLYLNKRQSDIMLFEPLFRFFNSKDPFNAKTIEQYYTNYSALIEKSTELNQLNPSEFVTKCLEIASKKFPNMVHTRYNGSFSFDCSTPNNLCLKKNGNLANESINSADFYNDSLISIYYNTIKEKKKYESTIIKEAFSKYLEELQYSMNNIGAVFDNIKKNYLMLHDIILNNLGLDFNVISKRRKIKKVKELNIYNILFEFLANISDFSVGDIDQTLEILQMYYMEVSSYIAQFRALETDVDFLEKAYDALQPTSKKAVISKLNDTLNQYHQEFLDFYIKRKTSIEFFEKLIEMDEKSSTSVAQYKSTRRIGTPRYINKNLSERNKSKDTSNNISYISRLIETNTEFAKNWKIFVKLSKYLYAEYSSMTP